MRNLIMLLIGGVLGACAFHVYYLQLAPAARCGWDHPIDGHAKAACRDAAIGLTARGYAAKARRDLDSLIGQVAH